MIPVNRLAAQPARWQQLWREAISEPHELLQLLDLSHRADEVFAAATGFALCVPRGFVARMRRGDPTDPLLLQVLPQAAELGEVGGFMRDAVGDLGARAARGVLRKYYGRALLIATGSCAIHCRYCFRRHFPYAEETAAADRWDDAIAELRGAAHFEVPDARARDLVRKLAARLPGNLVPRWVREVAGAASKMPLYVDRPDGNALPNPVNSSKAAARNAARLHDGNAPRATIRVGRRRPARSGFKADSPDIATT